MNPYSLALLFAVFVVTGCESVRKMDFASNPVEYAFHASTDMVATAVARLPERDPRFRGFSSAEFSKTGTEAHRIALIKFFGPVNQYPIYYYKNMPAEYYGLFEVYVYPSANGATRVRVSINGPRILVPGHGFNVHSFGFDQGRDIPVKATTVEEYEILLGIGKLVNEERMPALSLPNGAKPNQALEPTPGSVTPRAKEAESK